jgi:serine/threonine-protein kinase
MLRSPEAVAALPTIDSCDSPLALDAELPIGQEERDLLLSARQLLDTGIARSNAGDSHGALADLTLAYVLSHNTEFAPLRSEAADRLANVHSDLANNEYAEELYEEVVVTARGAGLERAAINAMVHLVFVVGYRRQRPEEGFEWARMARALMERSPEAPALKARLLENESLLYSDMGRQSVALERLEEALSIRREHHAERDVAVAMLYNNMGTLLAEMGRYDDAKEAHETALELRKNSLGEHHPEYAMSLINLAGSRVREGDLDEGIELGGQALEIWLETYGPRHPHTATTLTLLGSAHVLKGEPEKAIEYLERALDLRKEVLAEGHTEIATLQANLAAAYLSAKRYDEAEQALQQSLAQHMEGRFPDQSATAWIHYNLGVLEFERGDLEAARIKLEESLAMWTTGDPEEHREDHPEVAYPLAMLGKVHLWQKEYAKAAQTLERAHELNSKVPATPRTAYDSFLLARALWELGKQRPRAVTLAREARQELTDAPQPWDAEKVEVADWLAERAPDEAGAATDAR